MRNGGLEETQAGIKIAKRNINNLRYADDTTLMTESEEELKRLFTSSPLSAIRAILFAYLRFLFFSFVVVLVVFISPNNLDSSLGFIQPSVSHDVLCIEVK